MSKDIEMKPADSKKAESKGNKKKDVKEKGAALPLPMPAQEINTNVALIERGVSTLEPHFRAVCSGISLH